MVSPSNIFPYIWTKAYKHPGWLLKKNLGNPSSPKQPKLCLKTIRIYFECTPHPETVPNEGLQGFPTKNGIILVVTVTGKGPHPRYTSSSWCLCHSFEKYVRPIGSSPPRDRGEHSKRMLETYLPPIVINHCFQKMCFTKQVQNHDDVMIYLCNPFWFREVCRWKNPWGVHVTPAPRVYVYAKDPQWRGLERGAWKTSTTSEAPKNNPGPLIFHWILLG